MTESSTFSIEVSEQYDFSKTALTEIQKNKWVRKQWPIVYFIQNESKRIAYVGESTNALNRFKNHLANPNKNTIFNKISIVGSWQFNKSVTLDIEAFLIQYITAEGTYKLQNGNYGLTNHTYYQKELYKELFQDVWNKLIEKKIVKRSIKEIKNSELFKYSPYKSLNQDQYDSVIEILEGLTNQETNRIFISGSAGTGKTILATYLIKLLYSEIVDEDLSEFNENEYKEISFLKQFRTKYPDAKIGFVVAMTSLRKTLERVFKNIPGLNSSMILSPSDTFKSSDKFDLLIVDEAHRLRQYRNIGWRGIFKKNNALLNLGDKGNELDWILANSKNQIFFYDQAQSIKPSDVDAENFTNLLNEKNTLKLELKSQMRIEGGNDYVRFIDELLHNKLEYERIFTMENYHFVMFDSLKDLYAELSKKEDEVGLCRLVAGYSWPWNSSKNKHAIDIEIDGLKFQWNQSEKDWINSKNAFKEVGCIHTTQGYDLNYTGVIFGKEISYNPATKEIEILAKNYFDKNGKIGVKDVSILKAYIINIYKTLMYRGIKGTFVYVCDPNLREYLRKYIPSTGPHSTDLASDSEEMIPFVNSVPLYNLNAAAGSFSELQDVTDYEWLKISDSTSISKDHFACRVVGESMNKKIPNGSICLFKKDPGGSREGKIVLVQHSKIDDNDFGSGYTVKLYHSEKATTEEGWTHQRILLKPLSYDKRYSEIMLEENELIDLKVVGIFQSVIR